MRLEDALTKTWTAERAAEAGFRRARLLSAKGKPGAYTEMQVLFEK